jgi:hypothetical protein
MTPVAHLLAAALAVWPVSAVAEGPQSVDRLVTAEPALAALDKELQGAAKLVGPEDQKQWLAGREAACPAAAAKGTRREVAVDCLRRLYEQRLAALQAERNAAAWPHLRFRPALVEGGGTKLCEDLARDFAASFLGRGLFLDPLGEREIGFAPIAGLEDDTTLALRADIDPYDSGKPFPIVEWIVEQGGQRLPVVQYLGYPSEGELLAAIGRGAEPLTKSVRDAGTPIVDTGALPPPDPGKAGPRPRAFFADNAVLNVDQAWRFFRYDGKVYLLAPLEPAPDAPGDTGVYRLSGPGQLHRLCLFDAHFPLASAPDQALARPDIEAVRRAAAPLLPTGTLCAAAGDEARTLADRAAWRPWALDRPHAGEAGLSPARLALYLRNRALTGPEAQRQYHAYMAVRNAAIEGLAPFYEIQFGRSTAEAKRLATLYLDRLIADGFAVDPDDDAVAALLSADYAKTHPLQRAALAGDTAALEAGLGLEPKALAAGSRGELDEPLLSDALEHPDTLRALLEMGLDPNQTGASGHTPLMAAARLDLPDAALVLLDHGAAIDAGAGEAAAQSDLSGDASCMRAAPGAADAPGRTALSYAAERASPKLVRLLLDHGATAGKLDSSGRRPADYLKDRDPAAAEAIAEMLK